MIAVDLPTAVLVLGVLVLCATSAVTALGLPSVERSRRRRRRSGARRSPADQLMPPVVARRVVTGRPATINDGPPPPTARPVNAIELPAGRNVDRVIDHVDRAPAPGRRTFAPDHLPKNADDAEAFISQLVDDDPERMAQLMMQWMNEDDRVAVDAAGDGDAGASEDDA